MDELLFLLRFAAVFGFAAVLALVLWRERARLPWLARLGGRGAAPQCSNLGLADDPLSREARASEAHRCYAHLGRERVDLAHQQRFCLTTAHASCPFLSVKPAAEAVPVEVQLRRIGAAVLPPLRAFGVSMLAQMRTWWRTVSPAFRVRVARPQLGSFAGLGAVANAWLMERRPRVHTSALASRLAETQQRLKRKAPVSARAEGLVIAEPLPLVVIEPEPPRVEAVVPAAAHGPGLLPRVAAQEHELVERGIAAVEAGEEAVGYRLFKRATEVDRRAIRAWFWRANTAETLDEVIACLRAAHELDPSNAQIKANLESAQLRHNTARMSGAPAQPKPTLGRAEAPRLRRPGVVVRGLRAGLELVRTGTALAAFVVAAGWLLAALPLELRSLVLAMGGLQSLPVPDASAVTALVQVTLAGGYEIGSALPYGLGFLALFVGLGLLSGDGWTRLWAPALGLATAWLWTGAAGTPPNPALLPACGAVVLGGALGLRR